MAKQGKKRVPEDKALSGSSGSSIEDADLRPEDSESAAELDIASDLESLYKFGFGEDWKDLPTESQEMVKRRARLLSRRPRVGGIRLEVRDELQEQELDELERAATLEKAGGRGRRPRERRRGAGKKSTSAGSSDSPEGRKDHGAFLVPRLGPRR